MNERPPGGEFPPEELALIEEVRAKGLEDPATRAKYDAWVAEGEARVTEANTSRAAIELTLRLAKFARAAGYPENAMELLHAARMAAVNEAEDLLAEAERRMDEINREEPRDRTAN